MYTQLYIFLPESEEESSTEEELGEPIFLIYTHFYLHFILEISEMLTWMRQWWSKEYNEVFLFSFYISFSWIDLSLLNLHPWLMSGNKTTQMSTRLSRLFLSSLFNPVRNVSQASITSSRPRSQLFSPLSRTCSVLISVTLSWGMGAEEEGAVGMKVSKWHGK